MQSYTEKDLGKRTRYYQSLLDMDNLLKGQHYSELKECYVIFLCLYDPFEKDLPVYSFNRVCKESTDIDLQDSTHHIFFNCNAFEKEEDAELKAFLSYVKSNTAESNFTRRIEEMVQSKKFEQTFLNEYMAIKLHESDIERRAMAAGREQGRAEGIAQGEAKGRAEGITEGTTNAAVGYRGRKWFHYSVLLRRCKPCGHPKRFPPRHQRAVRRRREAKRYRHPRGSRRVSPHPFG